MGLLDGDIANAIYAGFKGKLLQGSLTRDTVTTVNERGIPVSGPPQTWSLEGFDDKYSDEERIAAGIPQTDAKICIFAKSLDTRPTKDDRVAFIRAGQTITWQLRERIDVDPAGAMWECQAYRLD